ncbi:MAG: hypothetical protein ACRC7O_03840, partial [Fimbriiglobus sp.]
TPVYAKCTCMVYHLDGDPQGLKMNRETIRAVFAGEIKSWDEAAIRLCNPRAALLPTPITPGYAKCYTLSNRVLSMYARGFESQNPILDSDDTHNWIRGIPFGRSTGVGVAMEKNGAIAFCPYGEAIHYKLSQIAMQNRAGNYVTASRASVFAALPNSVAGGEYLSNTIISSGHPDEFPAVTIVHIVSRCPSSGDPRLLHELVSNIMHIPAERMDLDGIVPLPSNVISHYSNVLHNAR